MPVPPSARPQAPPPWQPDFAESPLFSSVAASAHQFSRHEEWPTLDALNQSATQANLCNADGLPVRFVAQAQRLGQRDYEAQILRSGWVPTRMGQWHDLLNALVWLSFPHTKARLNAIQCHELAQASQGRRGPRSDAATLFDESGLVLVSASRELPELLRARRWREAFVSRREAWRTVGVLVFGHALLEKALRPFPAMTAKCLHLQANPDAGDVPRIDELLADRWTEQAIRQPADLFPVPVLGIPGIWQGNNEASFYEQETIFRPA